MRRIGVDIGGTFTDIVYLDDDAMAMLVEKVPTTPADLSRGVLAAIRKLNVAMTDVELVIHGATAELNAVIQQMVARVVDAEGAAAAAPGKPSVPVLTSRSLGGLHAATRVAAVLDLPNVVVLDVGGTSSDIAVIKEGPAQSADIRSLAVGAGSIARLDVEGRLVVGPEGVGADPGPVCYGRGGTEPTATDAAVVNGLIDPACFLGGEVQLKKELALEGVQRLADRLGLNVNAAAEAILNAAGDNLARAAREHLVDRGCNPQDFALVACGGAGGLFAAGLTRSLALQRLVIPPHPGVYSAYGLLRTAVAHDLVRLHAAPLMSADPAALAELHDTLQQEGRRLLACEGLGDEAMHFCRTLEIRCDGLKGFVSVEVPPGPLDDEGRRQVAADFAEQLQTRFCRRCETEPRIVAARLKAVGEVVGIPLEPSPPSSVNIPPDAFKGSRMVYLAGSWQECVVLDRAYLLPANSLIGPLIVEERQHTTVVLPGQHFMVDAYSNLLIQNP